MGVLAVLICFANPLLEVDTHQMMSRRKGEKGAHEESCSDQADDDTDTKKDCRES
jgi:hypothetical protein